MHTDIHTMRAVVVPRYGKAEVLEIAQRPIPTLKKGQVLVKNHASCVKPRDWLVREGKYVLKFALPPKLQLFFCSINPPPSIHIAYIKHSQKKLD